MAAISPQGNIQMFGTLDTLSMGEVRSQLDAGNILAVADTEQELVDLARKIQLGAKELERRDARRKQQRASRKRNR